MSNQQQVFNALKIRGPYRGGTGYDHHTREFVRHLYEQGIDIQLEDIPWWSATELPEVFREKWFDTLHVPLHTDFLVHFSLPTHVYPDQGKKNINFTMFEASRIPKEWLAHNLRHDLVILPTESSKDAWIESGYPADRIRLCPLGIKPAIYRKKAAPLKLSELPGKSLLDYKVRMLNVSDMLPRKNLFSLIECWIQATEATDDAILIVKAGGFQKPQIDKFRYDIKQLYKSIGKKIGEFAPIHFIFDLWPYAFMASFYAIGTHYISMSRGEGWDLPMMEAGASGLKLIAPNHTAYKTYLNSSTSSMIPATLQPANFGMGPAYAQDLFWWEPDPEAAMEIMYKTVKGIDDQKDSPQSYILENYSWEKASLRLTEILHEMG